MAKGRAKCRVDGCAPRYQPTIRGSTRSRERWRMRMRLSTLPRASPAVLSWISGHQPVLPTCFIRLIRPIMARAAQMRAGSDLPEKASATRAAVGNTAAIRPQNNSDALPSRSINFIPPRRAVLSRWVVVSSRPRWKGVAPSPRRKRALIDHVNELARVKDTATRVRAACPRRRCCCDSPSGSSSGMNMIVAPGGCGHKPGCCGVGAYE